MQLQFLTSLALAASAFASPVDEAISPFIATSKKSVFYGGDPKAVTNSTYFHCTESSTDPNCKGIKNPLPYPLSRTLLPDGTWTAYERSNWTIDDLKAHRKASNVTFNVPDHFDPAAEMAKVKRDQRPQTCYYTEVNYFHYYSQGYLYQPWKQVGQCFYCDDCTKAISSAFAVTDTFTFGLSAKLDDIITLTFSFAESQATTLTSTSTCQWKKGEEYGCHSIWYSPQMFWHHGYPTYSRYHHCLAGGGSPASTVLVAGEDSYAEVNQAVQGVEPGLIGCNSGCQGSDHRQCNFGNNGGALWPGINH